MLRNMMAFLRREVVWGRYKVGLKPRYPSLSQKKKHHWPHTSTISSRVNPSLQHFQLLQAFCKFSLTDGLSQAFLTFLFTFRRYHVFYAEPPNSLAGPLSTQTAKPTNSPCRMLHFLYGAKERIHTGSR